jgi:very-short-patch-repair endonuclease
MNVPQIDALGPSATIQLAAESGSTEGITTADMWDDRWYGRLRQTLEKARRELVDPSRRNRLLHAPLTGKRPWCMAIIGHDADELFDALHRQENFRGYAFQGRDEDENRDASIGTVPPSTPATVGGRINDSAVRPNGRPRLQTRLAHDKLEKRLTKIYREERTLEEEQGISTLYLALGFLKWFDSDQSEEPSFAPLMLLPASLDRIQGRDGYALSGRDDDIVMNVSLREKLREFEIVLPEIPVGDDWKPSDYFSSVKEAVNRQRRFEVDQTGVGLGFFTFSKFMMWRDLDVDVWPNGSLVKNALLGTLLGEGTEFENGPPIVSDDEPIDHKIDLSTAIHVVDADSSQAIVIEEARGGRNLVVQGPPGTGKSQTITNIIAAAVYAGRSVLFVAEKAAALEVVHDRLKRAGLGALCLEMHSRKSNKREVLKSLEEALRLSGSARFDPAIASRLSACRDKLNEWSSVIHKPIGRSGRAPFDVIGAQLKLRVAQARLLEERLDEAAEWSDEKIASAERATDRANVAIAKLQGPPNQHPWYDTGLDLQNPFDRDRLIERLTRANNELDALSKLLDIVFSSIAGRGDPSFADARNTLKALRHIAVAPVGRVALNHPAWVSELTNIETAIAQGQRLSKLGYELAKQFRREAWTFDTTTLLLVLRADGPSFFRKFSERYRRGLADLRALCKTKPPKKLEERIALVEKLQQAQATRREFSEQSTLLSAALGPVWSGVRTDWSQAIALLEWTLGALSLLGKERLFELASRDDLRLFSTFADRLETLIQKASKAFTAAGTHVKPGSVVPFGETNFQDVPIHALRRLTATWLANTDKVNDWVSARNALLSLRKEGLALIADPLEVGDLRPAEARSAVDLLVAEALWWRATSETPELSNIDGVVRSEQVAEFRSLDARRIQICQQEVLARYLDQKPIGSTGEMGIIRGQIERKRGHFPVRKLFEHAGSAIQRLKPVFLMSPLSVAQFLPQGKLTFDILVIDEASQVAPEDALGAVARTKQVIVVGDHKQLPPTNFFKMVNAGGDDGEEGDEQIDTVDRVGDYESILTLARSRGMAERMLAWHYRSKHPSLIALSNDECYGGRLLLPPSPFVQTAEFGLSLVQTPRGHYDRGGTSRDLIQAEQVAKVVADHIKRYPNKSLGVACLSAQQRDGVEDMIDKLGIRMEVDAFSAKGERLFVKNLEAIQGDERDVIFISVGYGVAADQSKPFLNFGPVSRDGGDRRLNVLASRAREKCVVFSSITAADIPADSAVRGTRMLRALLHFAETGKLGAGGFTGGDFDSPFEEAVARVIREAGYDVHSQVGVSSFRIDLGIIDPARPGQYILGVECDGATYHRARSARDRDRLRQEVLEGRGWRLYRIWSTDWFRNPQRETDKLIEMIRKTAEPQRGQAPVLDQEEITSEEPEDDAVGLSPPNLESVFANRHLPSNVEDYRECALSVPVGRALLDLSVSELARLSRVVVEAEGPIHTEEVARRIREAFGLQKTGRRILTHIKNSLILLSRDGALMRDGEFWSVPGRSVGFIRNRRTAALPLRKPVMIAPAEYQLAICAAVKEAVALTRADLVIQAARLFGFDRTGADLRQEIEQQVDAGIRAKAIIDDGQKMRMA